MPATPQSKFVKVNGINLHYLEWGDPAKPDLLLSHGWTGWARGWGWLAERLQGEYHIIAPDHRGHGESDKPGTGYRLRDFCDDLHALIQALGLKRPCYAGDSWGGCIGTVMAADYAQDIAKAFLGDPVYWKMINAFVTSLPQGLEQRRKPEAELRTELAQAGMTPEQIDTEVLREHTFSEDALRHLLTDNRDFAFTCEEYLRRIQVPTYIIAADPQAPGLPGFILHEEADYMERIASPLVRIVRWKGIGHGVWTDQARYERELRAFLAE